MHDALDTALRRSRASSIVVVLLVALPACSLVRCDGQRGGERAAKADQALRDALRDGDEAEARRQLERGASASAAAEWSVTPRSIVRGEPGDWLGSYLKYHQLLWIRFYEDDLSMCASTPSHGDPRAPASASDVAEGLGDVAEVLGDVATRAMLSFEGVTALHSAAFFCRPSITRLLLDVGADPNARDGAGLTPLHWAACAEVAELLVAGGANVSAVSHSGLTPLHTAIDVDVVRVLMQAGATLDARDRCGNTPLHFASSMGLSFGGPRSADGLTARDDERAAAEAPLWARLLFELLEDTVEVARLLTERFDVVGSLCAAGADASAENETGATPAGVLTAMGSGGDD